MSYDVEEYFLWNAYKNKHKLFTQMIGRFFKDKSSQVLYDIKNIIHTHPKNAEFYSIYKKYIKKTPVDLDFLLSASSGRQRNFIKQISQLFENNELKIVSPDSIYVDYGCNDGAFAVAIAKHFKLPPKNVYCCDIIDCPPLVKKAGFNYIKINLNNIKESIMKLPDIDLLTIINVLHHIPPESRGEIFKALDLKLKKMGNTIVKEHNCNMGLYNDEYKSFIKTWHNLYIVLYEETDFMGEINFISLDHLKVYMIGTHSVMRNYIPDENDDILKSYLALFVKYGSI